MPFCDQLSKLRKRQNITQIDMANRVGVKQYVISSWETGRSEPNINQIIKISDILNIPIDYLFDKEIIRVSSEEEFNKVIENMNEDTKDEFMNCVRRLCCDMSDERKEKIF